MVVADAVMPVSVVLERRAAESRWADYVWRPVGVLIAAGDDERGRVLAEGEGWAHYHGGTLDIELFRGEAEGYLTNLSQVPPKVYVVLRRNEDADVTEGGTLEFEPFLVTVCPYEAMGYSEGSEVVEGVPMPPEIVVWLRDFVARHYVETPFVKRKNKRHQDDYGARRPHVARERGLS
jgi:hypothetical protein